MNPIILIHLGQHVPRYILWSARRVAKHNPGRVIFLADAAIKPRIHGVKVEQIDSFYSGERFHEFAEGSNIEREFRDGFWLKAAERFFVLAQYMRTSNISSCWHIESDVLIFSFSKLQERLNQIGSGVFLPRDSKHRAIASIMYVNSLPTLERLLLSLNTHQKLTNEMEMLARFLDADPAGHSLPTADFLDPIYSRKRQWESLSIRDIGGVVDAAGMGQWIGGIDPRNSSKRTTNHFRNEVNIINFEKIRFRFRPSGNTLSAKYGSAPPVEIYNLHLHSKDWLLFASNFALKLLVTLGNWPIRLPMRRNPL